MSDNPSPENDPNADQSGNPNDPNSSAVELDESSSTTTTTTTPKLRKIPHIPIRRTNDEHDSLECINEEDDAEDDEEENEEELEEESSSPIVASALGLNHVRTRAASSTPTPSRLSASVFSPLNPISEQKNRDRDGAENRIKWAIPRDSGKRVPWTQSKSLKAPSGLNPEFQAHHIGYNIAKEMQSPRFKAVLRVTSGRRKRSPADIKSFSHELNSKGVRPFPFWKSRALGHPEEIMAVIKTKFERLKEEVNSDLGIFAGDLVSILENNAESHPEWRETLEDLLVVARECAMMSAGDFWKKCEGIVQNLDDHRQELPMGTLKQAYTRILFILTRCTRLLQFQKEGLFVDENILGLHQLSDLGVYSEKFFGDGSQGLQSSFGGKEATDKKESRVQEQSTSNLGQDNDDQHSISSSEPVDSGTAKSVDSSRDRISSWKKLPPPADKNRKKGQEEKDEPSNEKLDPLQLQEKGRKSVCENNDNHSTAEGPTVSSDVSLNNKRVSWGLLGDKKNVNYKNSMICRICEFEIPTLYVEDHSKICTIADRCDLKGLTVNKRFERVAETLEKIVETCTPNGSDNAGGSPEVCRISSSSIAEEYNIVSPRQNNLSRGYSDDMADCVPESDNTFVMDHLNGPIDIPFNTISTLTPDQSLAASSGGSTTPRSPLLTPRTCQIELLLGGSSTISYLENFQQIHKLVDIAHCVARINTSDYSSLEYLLDRLEDLKYVIQDRKVDALIVETFGRRIEKLLQEKYVNLCGQIDDEKADSSSIMVDEDSLVDDDTVRSLRASPLNANGKDRTSIEDFEIIKPISRGAFGRVFLARKRATGDLFAIKVLRKDDMIRKNAVDSILAERNILISLRNPFVVRFFYSFTCRENLYLVMEYLNGGDLYSLLRNLGCLEEDMARVYIAELVLALEYLHSLNVIHRDLKPDNILIAHDGHIKLTDFGLSKVGLINSTDDLSGPAVISSTILGDGEPKTAEKQTLNREQRQRHSAVGTPDYLAPEILLGMGHGVTADWWSVGVILFELLVGIPPFNADHAQKIFDNIMNRDITWPQIPEEMTYEAYDLIDKLLIENPLQRLGATGAREVKSHAFFKDINWDTLARQKAAFIPSAGAYDTSYFLSRYIWNQEDGHLTAEASDFDDMTESCSLSDSSSFSNQHDEDGDECGNLADFGAPDLSVKYSFSNFSFKNLSQLASINYDMVVKIGQGSNEESKPFVP